MEEHQNTVYWVDTKLAQKKGFKFCQTRSNTIILYDTLPAYCIPKVVVMETGEIIHEKVNASPRPPPKISFKDNWMKEFGSEVAGGSEDSQQIQPKSKTQLSRTGRLVSDQPNDYHIMGASEPYIQESSVENGSPKHFVFDDVTVGKALSPPLFTKEREDDACRRRSSCVSHDGTGRAMAFFGHDPLWPRPILARPTLATTFNLANLGRFWWSQADFGQRTPPVPLCP